MNDKTHIQISMVITCVVTLFLFIMSCEAPESLEPVSGAEGMLVVSGEWPDSIKGIIVAAFLPEVDFNNPVEYLVDYSGVLEADTDTLHYFIQLYSGSFVLAPVGISLDPAFVIANFDSISSSQSLPFIDLVDSLASSVRSVGLREQSVRQIPIIILDF